MSESTDIQWCDSSLNIQMGCQGCELFNAKGGVRRCYAGVMTERMLAGGPLKGWPASFDQPQIFPERIKQALAWSDLTNRQRADKSWLNLSPRIIFLNDMGDTFTEGLPLDWMDPFIPQIAATPHIYILLTKRPSRMREFFKTRKVPGNFWLGTSITTPNPRRLDELCMIDCAVKCVSYEPAWKPVNFEPWFGQGLNWMKLGGESGPEAKPQPLEILLRVKEQCAENDVACFIKQLGSRPVLDGKPLTLQDHKGGDWDEWPDQFKFRQLPFLAPKQSGQQTMLFELP